MKRFDFIIGYEHKNREIESVCLLKYELVRRGYKVLTYNTNDERFKEHIKQCYTEVLLLPYAYDDKIVSFCTKRAIGFKKLINMQWEQAIYKQQEENAESYRNPSGICKQAVQLSWGRANVSRLTKIVGIDQKRVKLVGNMTLDFLKDPLMSYYMTKEDICHKYNIPSDKKICLFIASFKSALANEEEMVELCKLYGEWRREQKQVALRTVNTILDWIQNALDADPELYFIYRPHPGETTTIVDEIQKYCERFVVIKDLSVKQWILISDKIYTWMSTTVAEVYFAKKGCYILYPYELPEEAIGRLMENMDYISDYETFESSLKSKVDDFPVDVKILNEYYTIDQSMSYMKVADVCEEVLGNSYYQIETDDLKRIYKMATLGRSLVKKLNLYLWQVDWFYNLFWYLITKLSIRGKYFEKKRNDRKKYEKWKKEEVASEDEIRNICNRIKQCMDKM